ncbi:dihydrodipicolinate synthase family protein [Teredinibacter sp. KSP-S5-2]|uniref:dihydrodipicolinate synthase family protein n=1 Tax=Teredinibacter sp. KSP-S5-2 TaxID=3034506 RepID=UPI00293525F4|nr:dihydrodipicolinate synthase family protein [Teredinibacter sp. KSP-S5-2]WNO07594.1 dihydrodipicolinate synthase family protein [Teredinibacter sp. KSP-S5-2]
MNLSGIIAYPITPFTEDEQGINYPILAETIELLIRNGSDAIAPLGSTGESSYLSLNEWKQVAEFSVKQAAQRVPVIIGISELTTEQAIVKAKYAEMIGADGIMVIPVSYWKLTDQEIYDYYQAISDSTSLPIMVYNNPATSGVDMSPELIVSMFFEIPNIKMVKESTGDIQRMHRIYKLSSGKLPFFNGSNPLAFAALCAGASGWCTAAPNLLGKLPKTLYEKVKEGKLADAQEVFYQQLPLLRYIVAGGLPKTIKAGLSVKGIDAGQPRKPLHSADATERKKLQQMLVSIEG